MIILLSPTKNQNFNPAVIHPGFTQPLFRKEAETIVELMRQLSPSELAKLLGTNAELTRLNIDRLYHWKLPFKPDNSKQTILAFDGEVFRGLHAVPFCNEDYQYAQNHLFILSGLYGALRPLDLIQPYRLEVSSRLENIYGRDLYTFWRDKVSAFLQKQIKLNKDNKVIINLASSEYFKMIDFSICKKPVISPEFFMEKGNELKQIVIYTKRARGLMAGFILRNKLKDPEDLKAFNEEGYMYHPGLSTEIKPVFIR